MAKLKLAENHPDRLTSQSTLAGMYRDNGQIDKAIEIETKLAKICKQDRIG